MRVKYVRNYNDVRAHNRGVYARNANGERHPGLRTTLYHPANVDIVQITRNT